MAPTSAKSLMKDFRASFRRKKVTDSTLKIDRAKELEDEELAKLVELKENLGDNLPSRYTDADLLGFLRARCLNVKEAEKLTLVDRNLRLFLDLDEFVKTSELSALNTKYSVSGIIGYDKEGSLVRVINLGYSDIKGFLHCVSTIDNFKSLMWYLEKDRQRQEIENRRTGRKKLNFVYIINLENVSMSRIMYKPAVDTALLAVKLLQDHYQDAVKTAYVVNAPTFISSFLKLFKPIMQDSLHQRIRIFDNDGSDELLKVIDAEVLPAYLGGNRLDAKEDPLCKSFIGFGGMIPETCYSNDYLCPDDPEVTCITVPAGSFVNRRFPVPVLGSRVRFHIQAKENDIGIAIYLEADNKNETSLPEKQKKKKEEDLSNLEQLSPIIRSQCHICPEVGAFTTWFTGTVIVHLDNTYSWMNSKEVYWKVSIEPPKEDNKNTTSTLHAAGSSHRKLNK